jgi:hypothetical protein
MNRWNRGYFYRVNGNGFKILNHIYLSSADTIFQLNLTQSRSPTPQKEDGGKP